MFCSLNKNQILVKVIINKEGQIWTLSTPLKSIIQITHWFLGRNTVKCINMKFTFIFCQSCKSEIRFVKYFFNLHILFSLNIHVFFCGVFSRPDSLQSDALPAFSDPHAVKGHCLWVEAETRSLAKEIVRNI